MLQSRQNFGTHFLDYTSSFKGLSVKIPKIPMEDITQVAEFFSIVHHIPGRIRIRVNVSKLPAIKKWAKETTLREVLPANEEGESFIITLLQSLPAVKNIKVNAIVGSATIEYDKNLFEPNLWESWVKKKNLAQIEAKLNEFSQNLGKGIG
ncbi:hypothetical protein [Helicobacter macacae]|uniref:Uncharacterized protein n=1 Tax=Helicobacter macacae MIT 99-5501 TaxID=1357400 RepID=V8C957_9HELI|nr:hypothetical protein [Helicobacter macacae]ETD23291.1 hypothetical protein HMPREF2086_01090 [Helicobacter macacae MIT 99-5501]